MLIERWGVNAKGRSKKLSDTNVNSETKPAEFGGL